MYRKEIHCIGRAKMWTDEESGSETDSDYEKKEEDKTIHEKETPLFSNSSAGSKNKSSWFSSYFKKKGKESTTPTRRPPSKAPHYRPKPSAPKLPSVDESLPEDLSYSKELETSSLKSDESGASFFSRIKTYTPKLY